jgi:hypothetical protein
LSTGVPAAHRESDLLAFEIAIERAQPGPVMTGYNKINGDYAGRNTVLIQDVLKGARGYARWVMSDWGATPRRGRAGTGRQGIVLLKPYVAKILSKLDLRDRVELVPRHPTFALSPAGTCVA